MSGQNLTPNDFERIKGRKVVLPTREEWVAHLAVTLKTPADFDALLARRMAKFDEAWEIGSGTESDYRPIAGLDRH
jgi:hypothetical protein